MCAYNVDEIDTRPRRDNDETVWGFLPPPLMDDDPGLHQRAVTRTRYFVVIKSKTDVLIKYFFNLRLKTDVLIKYFINISTKYFPNIQIFGRQKLPRKSKMLTTFFHFRCLIGKGFAGSLVFEGNFLTGTYNAPTPSVT